MKRTRRLPCALLTVLLSIPLGSCATNHLFHWSRGEASIYPQPSDKAKPYVVPAGTVIVLPVALAWDVATFPFQWIWGAHPYGDVLAPENLADPADR